MIAASCCCKAIQFELSEKPSMMGTCHCSRCRKLGANIFVFVKSESLNWISGKEDVAEYEPEDGYLYHRSFCKKCGTALGEILSEEDSFPISAHLIDSDVDMQNHFHEFVAEKPSWLPIGDDAKQFDRHPQKED